MVRPLQKSKSINLLETYILMLRTYVYKDLRIASDTRAKELIYMRKPMYVMLFVLMELHQLHGWPITVTA